MYGFASSRHMPEEDLDASYFLMSCRYVDHLALLMPPLTNREWTKSKLFASKVKGRLMSSSYTVITQLMTSDSGN